jgi:lysophospholipase L1-like esterase
MFARLLGMASLSVVLAARGVRAELVIKSGDQIAFLGDSITSFGMLRGGWVSLVIAGLESAGVQASALGAGLPGSKSADVLARLRRRVLDRHPTWLVVSCGVNDVWKSNAPLDEYQVNMTQVVDTAQAAGIKVMILTATMIGEDPASPDNQKLASYNAFLRRLAEEKHCVLADLNAAMQQRLADLERAGKTRGHLLTSSGAHLNAYGNVMMATGVLRAFGMDAAALAKATEIWLDMPAGVRLGVSVPLTLRQFGALEDRAAKAGKTVQELLQPALERDVATLLGK